MRRPSWWKILKYCATALLASWTPLYTWAASQKSPDPWYVQALVSFKIVAPLVAVGFILIADVHQELREQSSRRQLKGVLDHLHKKYFPHPDGGLSPSCRITLFAPGTLRTRSLGIRARSGGLNMTSRVRWSINRSEKEQFHGVTGYAWATGIFVALDDLPDYDKCSPAEQIKYLHQTFITDREAEKLH